MLPAPISARPLLRVASGPKRSSASARLPTLWLPRPRLQDGSIPLASISPAPVPVGGAVGPLFPKGVDTGGLAHGPSGGRSTESRQIMGASCSDLGTFRYPGPGIGENTDV